MLGYLLMRQPLDNEEIENSPIGRRQLSDSLYDLFIGKDVYARLLLIRNVLSIFGQHLPIDIAGILTVMIDTGIHQDALEPTLQRC